MTRGLGGMASLVLSRLKLPSGSRPPGDLPPEVVEAWKYVRGNRLTYLSDSRLASLARLAVEANCAPAEAAFIEAGCALGGSTLILCSAKSPARRLLVYDVFGTIPEPGVNDGVDVHERYQEISSGRSRGIGGDRYYGYRDDLYQSVARNIEQGGFPLGNHHVSLVKGRVQDTLAVSGPVALAHVDVDWYDPVHTCLDRIVPHLVPGGVLVLDDFQDWSGCRKAVDDYFRKLGRDRFTFDTTAGHLIVRVRA